jgi:hypothetical protein
VWLFVRPLLAIAAAHPPLLRALTKKSLTMAGACLQLLLFFHICLSLTYRPLPAKKKWGSVGINHFFLKNTVQTHE